MKQSKSVYSLIPLDDFKALLGIDDREEALARFCLTIAAHTIEQHCMRRLLRKKHFEASHPRAPPKCYRKRAFWGLFLSWRVTWFKKDGSFGDVRAPLAIKNSCRKMTLNVLKNAI